MLIIGSRPLGQWLTLCGLGPAGNQETDGSPVDAIVLLALNLAGIYVLSRRRVMLGEIIRNNRLLTVFIVYCFLSVFWSDFPFVACKRLIKEIGMPVMALVVLSEPDRDEALWTIMKRSAFVLLPVSILFCKYYPKLGRSASEWGTENAYTGITQTKNIMGCICFILGLVFVWHWFKIWKMEKNKARRDELVWTGFFLWMIAYLFLKSKSATALGVFVLGLLIMYLLSRPWVNKNRIGSYAMGALAAAVFFEFTFGISGFVFGLIGRNSTFTGRVEIWKLVLRMNSNPILGTGFESFWLGDRLKRMWDIYWWHPNQAHNGYIETYLDLGLVGLFLLLGVLLAVFFKCKRDLLRNSEVGGLQLACLAAIVFYNWTESAFKGLHPVFLLFFIIALDYPGPPTDSASELGEAAPAEEDAVSVST
jgi:O-antigen ligase